MGIFSDDPYLAGNFGIQVVACIGGLGLFITSMIICQPVISPPRQKRSCFGFRWSILLFTIARLVTALELGIPDATYVPVEFDILGVFATVLQVISEVILVYAIVKTALHPLRAHGAFRRDTTVALLLAGGLFVVGLALVGSAAAAEAAYIQYVHLLEQSYIGGLYINRRLAYRIQDAIGLLYDAVAFLIGVSFLAFSIYAMRKVRNLPVDPKQRTIPRKTLIVSIVWLVTWFVVTILDGLLSQQDFAAANFASLDYGALLDADIAFSRLLPLVIYTVLIFCFRGQSPNAQTAYPPQQGYGGQPVYYPQQAYGGQPNNFPPQQYYGGYPQPAGYPQAGGYPAPGQPYYPMQAAPSADFNKSYPAQAQVQQVQQPMSGQYQQPAGNVSPQSHVASPYSPPSTTHSPPPVTHSPPPPPQSPPIAPHSSQQGYGAHEMPTRAA